MLIVVEEDIEPGSFFCGNTAVKKGMHEVSLLTQASGVGWWSSYVGRAIMKGGDIVVCSGYNYCYYYQTDRKDLQKVHIEIEFDSGIPILPWKRPLVAIKRTRQFSSCEVAYRREGLYVTNVWSSGCKLIKISFVIY